MSNILMLSDHAAFSKRKASIQFIAEALERAGHEVRFVTTSFSLTSILKGDHRHSVLKRDGRFSQRGNIHGILPLRLYHFQNFHNHILNIALEHSLYKWEKSRFGGTLRKLLPPDYTPDIIIMESGLGIAYYNSVRAQYPAVRFIYWVNDSPKTIRAHPLVLKSDREIAANETVVIVSEAMRPEYPSAKHIEHGIDADALMKNTQTPYIQDGRPKIICVGSMLYAEETVHGAAKLLPDCDFIVIGPRPRKAPANVTYLGEMPFSNTIAYMQHADVGLAPYKETSGVSYISTSSLKIVQYMMLGLPIVCPNFAIRADGVGFFGYPSNDVCGMAEAIEEAIACGRVNRRLNVESWDQVTSRLMALANSAR